MAAEAAPLGLSAASAPASPHPLATSKALSAPTYPVGALAGSKPVAAGGPQASGPAPAASWVPHSEASAFPWASPMPLGQGREVPVGSYLIQFGVVLVILMILAWFSGKLARGRWKGAGGLAPQLQALAKIFPGMASASTTDLVLEARLPLDADRTAYVLACEGQRWLLAAGPGALTVVAELEARQEGPHAKAGGFTTAVETQLGQGGQA